MDRIYSTQAHKPRNVVKLRTISSFGLQDEGYPVKLEGVWYDRASGKVSVLLGHSLHGESKILLFVLLLFVWDGHKKI